MTHPFESAAERRAAAWLASHGEPIDDLGALAFHLRARVALGNALTLLGAAGIPALVVKGVVLATTLYESPIDRPIRDIDLRLRPADLGRAVEILVGAGGRVLGSSRVYANAVLTFRRLELDLETAIGPPFVCALRVEAMLARAERTDAGLGFFHLRPELHDHALLLAVNLFKDRLDAVQAWRLRDLELIVRASGFDDGALAARAEEAGCRTIVHIVGRHLERTLGDARWAAIAARISPTRPAYAARVLAALAGERRLPLFAWRVAMRAAADKEKTRSQPWPRARFALSR